MILGLGTVLVAVGIWWLLPGGSNRRRALGGVLALAGFGVFASRVPFVGDWLGQGLFSGMAAVTIVAAVATISFRSPVYCAIWFGMTLAGTAGLFLLAGAEFLAVATIVVYAGAILVTFLFVLMLAEPQGDSPYDRRSSEAMISASTGAVLIGVLTAMIGSAITAKADKSQAAEAAEAAVMGKAGGSVPAPRIHRRPAATISQLGARPSPATWSPWRQPGPCCLPPWWRAAVIVAQGRAAMKYSAKTREGGTARAS